MNTTIQHEIHGDHLPTDERISATLANEDLVYSAQRGCHYAFKEIERIYSRRLFNQIIAITRHHEDAQDALQEALYSAYVALPHFEHRCHISTWLSRIAINSALSRLRRRRGLQELSIDAEDSQSDRGLLFELLDERWSPEEMFRAKERMQQIARVAKSLDPISRRVLHLRADQDYSLQEIAATLNISVAAVKSRLYRARHSLRVFMPTRLHHEVIH